MNITEFARLGGKARARVLSKERRIEIARNAGKASAIIRQHASKHKQCQVTDSSENK